MSKSNYLENKLLDHDLGGTTYTPPATDYLALFTVAPTDAGGGTEVTGGAYARLAVTNNATNWPAASAGSKSNGVVMEFLETTADWGTPVAFALYDASSGGNLLRHGVITNPQPVLSGNTARFPIGNLVFNED